MGRRRRRRKRLTTIRRVRRQTKYFTCPICNRPTLTIDFEKLKDEEHEGMKKAIVRCGSCGLYLELIVPEIYERDNVYSMVVDLAYTGEIEKYMKAHAEEAAEAEEEEAEEEAVEAGEAGAPRGGEAEGEEAGPSISPREEG